MINKDKLCLDSWKVINPSRKDTLDTQKQVIGGNVAREAWCK